MHARLAALPAIPTFFIPSACSEPVAIGVSDENDASRPTGADAGTEAGAPATDIDGEARPKGGDIDTGPDEL